MEVDGVGGGARGVGGQGELEARSGVPYFHRSQGWAHSINQLARVAHLWIIILKYLTEYLSI